MEDSSNNEKPLESQQFSLQSLSSLQHNKSNANMDLSHFNTSLNKYTHLLERFQQSQHIDVNSLLGSNISLKQSYNERIQIPTHSKSDEPNSIKVITNYDSSNINQNKTKLQKFSFLGESEPKSEWGGLARRIATKDSLSHQLLERELQNIKARRTASNSNSPNQNLKSPNLKSPRQDQYESKNQESAYQQHQHSKSRIFAAQKFSNLFNNLDDKVLQENIVQERRHATHQTEYQDDTLNTLNLNTMSSPPFNQSINIQQLVRKMGDEWQSQQSASQLYSHQQKLTLGKKQNSPQTSPFDRYQKIMHNKNNEQKESTTQLNKKLFEQFEQQDLSAKQKNIIQLGILGKPISVPIASPRVGSLSKQQKSSNKNSGQKQDKKTERNQSLRIEDIEKHLDSSPLRNFDQELSQQLQMLGNDATAGNAAKTASQNIHIKNQNSEYFCDSVVEQNQKQGKQQFQQSNQIQQKQIQEEQSNNPILQILNETLSDQETKRIILKYDLASQQTQSISNSKECNHNNNNSTTNLSIEIETKRFIESVIREFHYLFDAIDEATQLQYVKEALTESLTIQKRKYVSLNALEVFSKNKGLYTAVKELVAKTLHEIKVKTDKENNELIINEVSQIKEMLEVQSHKLKDREQQVQARETKVQQKESWFKQNIGQFISEQEANSRQAIEQSNAILQKKQAQFERSAKQKLKLLENRCAQLKQYKSELLQLQTQQNVSDQQTQQALRSRNKQLQAQLDAMRIKHDEEMMMLSNKHKEEQSLRLQAQKRNASLNQKIIQVEQQLTEVQKQKFKETDNKDISQALDISELQLRIHKLGGGGGDSSQSQLPKTLQNAEAEEDAISNSEMQIQPNKAAKLTKDKGANDKKVSPATKMGLSACEDTKLLLDLIDSVLSVFKHSLPVFFQYQNQKKEQHQPDQNMSQIQEIDIGELLYPGFSKIMTDLVEVLPIILKAYKPSRVCTLTELFYCLLSFAFRFRVQSRMQERPSNQFNTNTASQLLTVSLLPREYLLNSESKSQQDHINEAMLMQSGGGVFAFQPQTAFWKRKLKEGAKQEQQAQNQIQNDIVLQKGKQSQMIDNKFAVFDNTVVQSEVTSLLRSYIQKTENAFQSQSAQQTATSANSTTSSASTSKIRNGGEMFIIPANSNNGKDKFSLENTKFTFLIRVHCSLVLLLTTKHLKDIVLALDTLLKCVMSDNQKLNEYVMNHLVAIDAFNVILHVLDLCNQAQHFTLVKPVADLLLTCSVTGIHYKKFIKQLCSFDRVNILMDSFGMIAKYNTEAITVLEKLSVIIQRICYFNEVKGSTNKKYIQMFKNYQTLQVEKDHQFLHNNIRSILNSIDQNIY